MSHSSSKHRLTLVSKSRTSPANGLMHLPSLVHSSSTSAKVSNDRSSTWVQELVILPALTVSPSTALEFVTRGLARATSHRVLSPPVGSTPRYSVPFFQNISLNARLADQVLDCASPILSHQPNLVRSLLTHTPVPEAILKLKDLRGDPATTDCT